MTISIKALLVIFAGLIGFMFGSVAFALECASGQVSGYTATKDGSIYTCPTPDGCSAQWYSEHEAESMVSIGSGRYRTREYAGGTLYTSSTGKTYSNYSYVQTITNSDGSVVHSTGTYTGLLQVTEMCIDSPDPEPDTCSANAGTEASFTSQDLYSVAGCVNGCLVSSAGGGRVQVQVEGSDGTVYTSGNYTGASCTGDESQYSKVVDEDNPPYKMELIDGVPTFTSNGTTIKLASDNTGVSGNLTTQLNNLNPDVATDVMNSSGSTGVDGSPDENITSDTVLQVTNVNNTTNINSSGYQVGYNSGDPSGGGAGAGTGDETGGETGGDTTVNVDLSGVESKLDGIQQTLDGIGDGVGFTGDDVGTFGSITSNFVAEIQGTGFIQAANNISFPSGAGTCPSFGVSVLGGNVSTTMHCEIWDSAKGVLSVIMLFVYGVFGIRTVMSA